MRHAVCSSPSSSCRRPRQQERRDWAPPLLLAILTLGAYAQFMSNYFQGGDTWPHIWTSQVRSVNDLLVDLSHPIMYGTTFPDSVALFFRPVSSLSYALDYAVWGMNPVPFHLTDLAIHVTATLALFALARAIGLRSWPAAVGVAIFTLHPIMASVVPDLPRRHDSLAGAFTFAALAIATWVIGRPSQSRVFPWLLTAGVLLSMGELAKESAFVGLLLVPPTLIAGVIARGGDPVRDWRRLAGATAVFAVASTAALAWRLGVLGGIGGYYDQTPPLASLDIALTNLLQNLLWPFREALGRTPRAWLTEIGIVVMVTGVGAGFGKRGARVAILYGWLWLFVCGLAQMLTKSVAAWQSYLTVGGFAFLVGGAVQALVDVGWTRQATVGAWHDLARRVAMFASGIGVAVFMLGVVRESVVMTRYDDWRVAGEIARGYLSAIQPCLEATPAGLPVMLNQYPGGLDDSTDQRKFIAPGILGPYSLGPAVYLVIHAPPPTINNSTLQTVLSHFPGQMTAVCHEDDGTWWIRTDYSD